jgi:hypothetical protein
MRRPVHDRPQTAESASQYMPFCGFWMEKYDEQQRMAVNKQALSALYKIWTHAPEGRTHGGISKQGATHRYEFTSCW